MEETEKVKELTPQGAKNFLVVSNYNNDIDWIKLCGNEYVIYDRSDDGKKRDDENIIKSKNVGYNLADYFTYIVDNYDSLPEYITFCKGNIFPRHMMKSRFEQLMNNKCFTPLFEPSYAHKPEMPMCMFACDGAWSEINNGISLPEPTKHPTKYISSYNELLKFCFINPVLPNYITFAAGGNYVVPKNNILKYSKLFYQNLRFIISHHQLAGEAHLVERALYTIWMCNFKPNPKANEVLVTEATFMVNQWQKLTTKNIDIPQSASTQPASRINYDRKNLSTVCHIRIVECERPFLPAGDSHKKMDAQIFNLIFDGLRFEDCVLVFNNEISAEDYLSNKLFPCMKSGANAIFAIEKTYKRI